MAKLRKQVAVQVLWHALAYHAKKMSERDVLPVLAGTPVSIDMLATAGGQTFEIDLAGKFIVNPDGKAASSDGPAAEDVLGWFFDQIGLTESAKLIVKLEKEFKKSKGKLKVDPDFSKPAAELLKRLRNTTTSPKRGSVRFEPAAGE